MQAPSLLLEDYNYFINKTILKYINKIYNQYEINQQRTDDLGALKSSALLKKVVAEDKFNDTNLLKNRWFAYLPDDYVHILGCIVEYKALKDFKCYKVGDLWSVGVQRMTSDMSPQLPHNYYMKPSYKKPYYHINNITTVNTFPTEDDKVLVDKETYSTHISFLPDKEDEIKTIILNPLKAGNPKILLLNFETIFELRNKLIQEGIECEVKDKYQLKILKNLSYNITSGTHVFVASLKNPIREKQAGERYGNTFKPVIEIRNGKKSDLYKINTVLVDYIKAPQHIRLTYDQIDSVEDTSQVLEFPDYVAQEIVNELVHLIMENASDPRIQTHIPMSQSIAQPQQEQAPQQRQRR